jgi:protein arginine kinase
MTEKLKLPASLSERTPWENSSNPIWVTTLFTLQRNLANTNFPSKMNPAQFEQTINTLKKPLINSSSLKNPTFLRAEELGALDKEFLSEHFLTLEGIQNALEGTAFVIDESSSILAAINLQNHLQLHLSDEEGNLEKTWNTLSKIETDISSTAELSFSPKFGFLTADPAYCGTALSIQAYLHLPALIHMNQLKETLLKQNEEGVSFSSMGGDLAEIPGDLLIVSNQFTLGVKEESIIQSIYSTVMKLMAMEKTLRSHLQTENNSEMKDQVSRAFGLLLHSYQLNTKESLAALSLVKLGLQMDWIGGITESKINTLFFKCRRAHLLHTLGEKGVADSKELSHKRAEFLHKNMQGSILKIEAAG